MGDIVFRGMPIQRSHGESIILSVVYGKLIFEIIKGIEFVGCVKVFVILSVGTFNLAVMPRRIRADQLVPYPQLFEASLKQRHFAVFSFFEFFNKLHSVVRLNTFNLKRKRLNEHI